MNSLRLPAAMALLAGTLVLSSAGAQAAVTEDNFVAHTTGDLLALCTAEPTETLYTAAVNFCHGFGAATYSLLATAQHSNPKLKVFCEPAKGVSRNDAVASFVTWARAKPDRVALPAVDGLTLFLADTYPCPRSGKSARRTP
jgi:hypothetical protein